MKNTHHKLGRTLFNLVAVGLLSASGPAWAGDSCVRGTLESEIDLLSPFGPGVGVAYATLGDQILPIQAYGEFVSSKVQGDGSIHLIVEENDSTPDGSTVQIRDKIVLRPTEIPGEYTMKIHSKVQGGTGLFADADGKYAGEGTATFNTNPPHLSHSGEAKFCGLPF